jgi:hypothetical protein
VFKFPKELFKLEDEEEFLSLRLPVDSLRQDSFGDFDDDVRD